MAVDYYLLAERRAARSEFARVRQSAREQLQKSGAPHGEAAIDEFLQRNWYRLPDRVCMLLWRAIERRESAAYRGFIARQRAYMAASRALPK